ncbi:Cytochrome P450, E-class, group I [Parasponia andersonii]|uniref:Cytochrome P450, E-class, group I n=1 Tax=Parasponia andersonii TaxID=3476 RepID=A0A2P5CAD0_PARAD|nr:Cytochrome P450, E-class, group I [Parasponia andersonii]
MAESDLQWEAASRFYGFPSYWGDHPVFHLSFIIQHSPIYRQENGKEVEKEDTFLSEDIAIDLAFVLLFATYETTSTAITLAVKFISDHPEVLAELVVINETVRLANIVPGIFRKVVHDVEVNAPSFIHLNLDKYDDPLAFNRSVAIEGSKTFMAFGGGVRLCVGADFVKLQMAIFIHHLISSYRWTVVKGGDIIRKPGLSLLELEEETRSKCCQNWTMLSELMAIESELDSVGSEVVSFLLMCI